MIEFVFGKRANPQVVNGLVNQLSGLDVEGTLYIGYPIFDVDDESLLTDALLITKEHGVIVFDLTTFGQGADEPELIEEYQDDLYRGLSRKFLSEKRLVNRRKLSFDIVVVSIRQDGNLIENIESVSLDDVVGYVTNGNALDDQDYKVIHGTIQKTSVLRPPKKRANVEKDGSFGSAIKSIEKEIANLDQWQKKAAIESPDKPQRVRGLAGCGKTIILAMKAAYLHAIEPSLNIVVTFQSRSLYQQLQKLVSRFYFEHLREDIDPECLQIIHAWGSTSSVGLYAQICAHIGIQSLSWGEAKRKYGGEKAFEGACSEALKAIQNLDVEPLYDYVLIDEAQDFPVSFFQLIYRFVRNPKHIVWAYDELQNLGEYRMLPPEELFGNDRNGTPNVTLVNEQGKPQQDILLPVCYRNPPWTLTLALALGLGIYREDGYVRMFPNLEFWNHIGYEVVGGTLDYNQRVSLQRSRERTPEYFYDLISPESAIICQSFSEKEQQAEWVANQIYQNVSSDELDIGDILIVFPDAYTLNSESAYVINELRKLGIDAHIAGVNTSKNVVFADDSVAIAHIHRAKGNEAPMVYVMNANYCYTGMDIRKKRNTLFTSITRAKAWVRITGVGQNMEKLAQEVEKIFQDNFRLSFTYPSLEQLSEMDKIFQDHSPRQRREIFDGIEKIKDIKKLIETGELSIDDLPEDLKELFL